MTIDEVLRLIAATLPNKLTPLQEFVLRATWEGKTYSTMAKEVHYGEERIRKVASNMWHLLSQTWEIEIKKSNFRDIWEQRQLTRKEQQLIAELNQSDRLIASIPGEFPNGPVPLHSPFYIPRPPLEETVNLAIAEPGGAACIKSPRKMGKSSLLLRMIAYAENFGYRCVTLDLQQADTNLFTNLDQFLRWLAVNIGREVGIKVNLEECWHVQLGSKVNCSLLMENHILAKLDTPLVLILNELDWILNYPAIAADVILLLQSWYERGKQVEIWQKLRLVVVYSSEILVPLNLISSPIDLGVSVTLPYFQPQQVKTLASRYGLDWLQDSHIDLLMGLVGGHPYLLRLAMYHLVRDGGREQYLQDLLEQASTETGIYSEYLHQYLLILREEPELAAGLEQVIFNSEPVYLEPVIATKLQNLGLIQIVSDRCSPACELYRKYFRQYLRHHLHNYQRIEELEQENQQLRIQTSLDEVTQIPNRRYFQTYLNTLWKKYAQQQDSQLKLALILCDIDYFNYYNRIYGNAAGDNCLQLIATTINRCLQAVRKTDPTTLLARYRDEQFAILLTAETQLAAQLAATIREQIKQLAIPCEYPGIGGLPANVLTVSLGVASLPPQPDTDAISLIRNSETALNLAKRRGRDGYATY
ncbi:AAA-like domain-containing protein [Calothrix sp. NIES-3974]|uniref:AAA-like domain-containing protein n=1 Tax=Calothrix sp. NIES-3974 TaxID=2005462 RepID=UPI000B5E5B4E|nr:AAA-like domain-containing protein [Calothrix sp. NIES-3974]BAZ06694.1 diguanylate cyclase [Calothrix sp. NIES-3974]